MSEQRFLEALSLVQERMDAGAFVSAPDVCMLANRAPAVVEELIRLRQENAELRREAELRRTHGDLLEEAGACACGGRRRNFDGATKNQNERTT